ncbi:hypothetical protein ACFLU4_04545 [Chloroflexota bacterium]
MLKDSTHSLFNESFLQYRRSIEQTKLKIIILGPAKQSPGYDKRVQIRDHLRSNSIADDVAFPEDITVPPEVLPNGGQWPIIDFIIANAQMVFALLVDDRKVTGVLSEVTRYHDKKGFRDKSYLILPIARKKAKGSYFPLIWEAAAVYPKDRTLRYKDEEFRDCNITRAYVAAKVDIYRRRLRWDEYMEKKGLTT